MPLYEYECQQCHRRVEKIQSFSAPPETVCPHCGGKLERVISAPAIQFKGAGWYINDYAKSGGGKAAQPASTPENKSETKTAENASPTSAAASDAKPAVGNSPASTSASSGSEKKSGS
jgi:putative FmdB family regulatory protein